MLQRVDYPGRIVTYQSPLLAQAGVRQGFSTRTGGVSHAPFDTLNLARPTRATAGAPQDDPRCVARNYQLLLQTIGCDDQLQAWVDQVHGRNVIRVDATNADERPMADGMVTSCRDVVLSIRVADCVPVLIARRSGRAVAAAHAGWRGLVAGVISATVAAMGCERASQASDLVAAVGPCIGPDHYEVGPKVVEAFEQSGLSAALVQTPTSRCRVDLAAAAVAQLTAAGISPNAIDCSNCCTFRDAELFFSHRRDAGVTGRMAAVIAVGGQHTGPGAAPRAWSQRPVTASPSQRPSAV